MIGVFKDPKVLNILFNIFRQLIFTKPIKIIDVFVCLGSLETPLMWNRVNGIIGDKPVITPFCKIAEHL